MSPNTVKLTVSKVQGFSVIKSIGSDQKDLFLNLYGDCNQKLLN